MDLASLMPERVADLEQTFAPAILNAINDAVGVRLTSLPATKQKVIAALRTQQMDPATP